MDLEKIEKDLRKISKAIDKESFLYDLLAVYGQPKSTITRLKRGDYNISKNKDEVIWKKKLLYRKVLNEDLHHLIDELRNDPSLFKHNPRFIILTDFDLLLAVDTKTDETLDISIADIASHYDFFLPWAGMEKTKHQNVSPADIKATERMGRLYDILIQDNEELNDTKEGKHALNVFLSRILFCFFAEDAGIFPDGLFTTSIASHTSKDGKDMQLYLATLFKVLNLKECSGYPKYLQDFPYVNGGLFVEEFPLPVLSGKSRKIIIEAGELDWSRINPDIFGSMMQAVVHHSNRSNLGMHYTSVENIMKVIKPLFLDELYEKLDKAKNNEKKLEKILNQLYSAQFFDPACGSGNFLTITFKELCRLEIKILEKLRNLDSHKWNMIKSGINPNQFYGIEIEDFAHEIAKLSLWLAEHQMNRIFKDEFGEARSTLPLKDSGNIVCGNAVRLDWEDVCPESNDKKTYILGNPPYVGSKNQEAKHKDDIKLVAQNIKGNGILDYVSCFFFKAADYISMADRNIKCAFVATSSICQGEQVAVLWPYVLDKKIQIIFAITPFTWSNNAKNNAGVHCVIVGLAKKERKRKSKKKKDKYLYTNNIRKVVTGISPYLIPDSNCIVRKRSKPISDLPGIGIGNKPIDDGNYLFTEEEKLKFIVAEPGSEKYFYRWYGGREFSFDIVRWCLLPQRMTTDDLKRLPNVEALIGNVRKFRLSSKSKPTVKLAEVPDRFHVENFPDNNYMVIQEVSTGKRAYLPVGFFSPTMISSNLLNIIDSDEPHIFGLLSSKMHMIWIGAVGGKFGNSVRYSCTLSYNTFPVPELKKENKKTIENHVFDVLDEREKYSEKNMAELYDPDKMPMGLRQAHKDLDIAVEQCYRTKPFSTDEERLAYLFKLYEEMIEAEKEKSCLI